MCRIEVVDFFVECIDLVLVRPIQISPLRFDAIAVRLLLKLNTSYRCLFLDDSFPLFRETQICAVRNVESSTVRISVQDVGRRHPCHRRRVICSRRRIRTWPWRRISITIRRRTWRVTGRSGGTSRTVAAAENLRQNPNANDATGPQHPFWNAASGLRSNGLTVLRGYRRRQNLSGYGMALPLIRTFSANLDTRRVVTAQDKRFNHVQIKWPLHFALVRDKVAANGSGRIAHLLKSHFGLNSRKPRFFLSRGLGGFVPSIIFSLSPCLRTSRVVASTGNPVMRKALFRNIPIVAASRRGRHSDKIFRELLHPLGSDGKPLPKTGFSLDNFSSDDTRSFVSNKEGLCESTARKGSNGLPGGSRLEESEYCAIFQIHNLLTAIFAKTLSFFLPAFRAAAPPSKSSKTLLALFPEMQSSHVVSLSSAPAGCATLHSTTRDHCGALGIILAERTGYAAGDCARPDFPHRLRVCLTEL